jgi:hypothetical protein
MKQNRGFALTALVVATGALALAAVQPSADAADRGVRHLHFTNTIAGPPTQLDLGPAGPSLGDAYYIRSTISAGDLSGRTSASCVITSLDGPGVHQCSIDFLTPRGVLSTHALTDSARKLVTLVVVGGTGRYVASKGSGTLTPTPTGSEVSLDLR